MQSWLMRAVRWEFWPMSLFYAPIVLWILLLSLRFRGLSFLSCNPAMTLSGLIGEHKAANLDYLRNADSPNLARFIVLSADADWSSQQQQIEQFLTAHDLTYPIVCKPDFGQRGSGVAIIRDPQQAQAYMAAAEDDIIVQEYIGGEEFGVFYLRNPNDQQGQIFSITEKTFPVVTGDGQRSFEQLLLSNQRTLYMADYLLDLHSQRLSWVPNAGEQVKVVEIGSHCRGSVFLDGNSLITPELTASINRISEHIEGFYFGRFDIRVPDKAHFSAGEQLKVLEVNGVTSESTNIYDPSHQVFTAYRILFKQWYMAFVVGAENIKRGAAKITLAQLVKHLYATYG